MERYWYTGSNTPRKGSLQFSPQFPMDCHWRSAVSERGAIKYFRNRLWPLLSTVHEPCPPPVALALRSQPVFQALYVFAEEHRALQKTESGLSGKEVLEQRHLQCLTVVRKHLSDNTTATTTPPALLVAVLLLYFLEVYVDCTQDDASTQCHLARALAIIDALGGFEAAWSASDRMTGMLLSELASTDLTDSMLQDREPSFPVSIWGKVTLDPCGGRVYPVQNRLPRSLRPWQQCASPVASLQMEEKLITKNCWVSSTHSSLSIRCLSFATTTSQKQMLKTRSILP